MGVAVIPALGQECPKSGLLDFVEFLSCEKTVGKNVSHCFKIDSGIKIPRVSPVAGASRHQLGIDVGTRSDNL